MLSLDAILFQDVGASHYGILKLFPDPDVRTNEGTTHFHTSVHTNSFPMHLHRIQVKEPNVDM